MSVHAPDWSGRELDVMRIGLGFAVIFTVGKIQFFRPQGNPSYPVGIARFVNVRWAGSRRVVQWFQICAYVATLCYVAELFVPYALVVLAVVVIVDLTYRSSFGSVNHGDHLIAVALLAQLGAVGVWDAAQHWGWDLGRVLAPTQGATAAWWTVQAIIAVYFTSGLAKLINTRGMWIARSPGLLLSALARADTERAMGGDNWGDSGDSDSVVAFLLARPGLARVVFAAGLFVEVGSPIGFYGETALLVVGLALLALHRANGRLLGLPFPQYQLLVLVYLVNVPRLFR
jgi:hypothetical protein